MEATGMLRPSNSRGGSFGASHGTPRIEPWLKR